MMNATYGTVQLVTAEMRQAAASPLDGILADEAIVRARHDGATKTGTPYVEWEPITTEFYRAAAQRAFGWEVRLGDWIARVVVPCQHD
jgi:hypothetical protein